MWLWSYIGFICEFFPLYGLSWLVFGVWTFCLAEDIQSFWVLGKLGIDIKLYFPDK